ncbi:MAG TPA: TonB-dependent receptor [Bryobacteraceae bacterium]|nr:TonB-dependent receptor [Bryobacteraceae bacterium]
MGTERFCRTLKARVKGGESAAAAWPTPRLKLSAGFGITDSKYVRIVPGAPVTTDSQFVNAPKYTFTAVAEYSATLRKAVQISGRVDYIHESGIQYDLGNSPLVAQASYGLLNARLTWQPHEFRNESHE